MTARGRLGRVPAAHPALAVARSVIAIPPVDGGCAGGPRYIEYGERRCGARGPLVPSLLCTGLSIRSPTHVSTVSESLPHAHRGPYAISPVPDRMLVRTPRPLVMVDSRFVPWPDVE